MSRLVRQASIDVVVIASLVAVAPALTQGPPPSPSAAEAPGRTASSPAPVKPSPAPSPSPSPTPGPIAASVDRIVQEVLTSREAPCRRADRDGVPCFPVWVEVEGPRYSVAESLRRFRADDSPSPDRPPTVDESWRYRPGYSPHSADFTTVDPGCVAKSLIKGLKGKNDVYYLYRLRDRTGERPLLRDRPIDPKAFDAVPDVEYTFLGRFEGECKALAAYRHALRNPPPKAERDVPEGAGEPPPSRP